MEQYMCVSWFVHFIFEQHNMKIVLTLFLCLSWSGKGDSILGGVESMIITSSSSSSFVVELDVGVVGAAVTRPPQFTWFTDSTFERQFSCEVELSVENVWKLRTAKKTKKMLLIIWWIGWIGWIGWKLKRQRRGY